MPQISGQIWSVTVTLMDSWSGPTHIETKLFDDELEANAYASERDQRGIFEIVPDEYVIARVRKVSD